MRAAAELVIGVWGALGIEVFVVINIPFQNNYVSKRHVVILQMAAEKHTTRNRRNFSFLADGVRQRTRDKPSVVERFDSREAAVDF